MVRTDPYITPDRNSAGSVQAQFRMGVREEAVSGNASPDRLQAARRPAAHSGARAHPMRRSRERLLRLIGQLRDMQGAATGALHQGEDLTGQHRASASSPSTVMMTGSWFAISSPAAKVAAQRRKIDRLHRSRPRRTAFQRCGSSGSSASSGSSGSRIRPSRMASVSSSV